MLKFIKQYADLSANEEIHLLSVLNKTNKLKIKQNIEYIAKVYSDYKMDKYFETRLALLLKEHPDLFLLDPNPQNNASIDSKIKFYQQHMDISAWEVIACCPNLLTKDTYAGSQIENILKRDESLEIKSKN